MIKTVRAHTKKNLKDEVKAIISYKKAVTAAKKAGKKREARLFSHILKEEKHHRDELKQVLRRI